MQLAYFTASVNLATTLSAQKAKFYLTQQVLPLQARVDIEIMTMVFHIHQSSRNAALPLDG